ncbi:MAG: hypothetical protein KJ556_01835 [Gammaproteobacteria bacterium]|nr:hypothetical protein [Gammaproteobacteria bacterium]MBU2057048.1 hypothetical protein [Gammaproteobacteria bacterium]MBU2173847.1 hypothetical protein [Gammaproteobacteria bacterium]MBU2249044.1 hypothetical protein [Gammaproteobacteria bacterium]MBU2343694.1 hypothetical protein [Gammaproteobacteria bacterium]
MSKLALKLIAENKQSKATTLDLGCCGLTELPRELAELVWLEQLYLSSDRPEGKLSGLYRMPSHNKGRSNEALQDIGLLENLPLLQIVSINGTSVENLMPLAGLKQLRELHALDCPLSSLNSLAGMHRLELLQCNSEYITDLSPLSGLYELQHLGLKSAQATDYSPLGCLNELKVLNLESSNVSNLSFLSDLSSLQDLDLNSTQVSDLSPLSGLSLLQYLNLKSTQVRDFSPLANLGALKTLNLESNQVNNLSFLSDLSTLQHLDLKATQVSDLSLLSGLSALRHLGLSSTKVDDLSPLSGLSTLEYLGLNSTSVSDLSPLSSLRMLYMVSLRTTQIEDLSPLANLQALQYLDLTSTNVTDISSLSKLTELQYLLLDSTQVSDLSPLRSIIERGRQVLVQGWSGNGIRVENCPLTIPPLEIVAQGNEAILSYFDEREAGEVDYLYEAKMLILGEGGAGKTSLLRRLYKTDEPLPAEQESTKGIDIYRHDFELPNGRTFRLNVWDFGGQEIYHATHQFFLTRRSLYLLLDDTRKDHKSVSDAGFKDWLDLIETFGDNSPALIFQNEKSGRSKAIGMDGIQARYALVKDCFKGNLEYPDAADIVRKEIARYAANLPHIGEQLPARWLKVRAEIELRAQHSAYISQQDYFAIYGQYLPFDRTKALHLSRYFHDLGVFLHFQDDPLLARTVILQNTWATQAVYRVLDDENVKKRHGRFDRTDCSRLWQDDLYADMHPELLALMQRFELCYLLPHSEPLAWFAPQLLPPNKPPALVGWEQSGDMVIRFRYAFMPKGIISRLMVRQHRLTGNTDALNDACLTSVLFRHNSSQAIAELLPAGSVIELRARGPERKVLLNVLANEIEAINQGFPGLHEKVVKLIPCICSVCKTALQPFMFEERNLLRRVEKKVFEVDCDCSFEKVKVQLLLDGVGGFTAATLPDWASKEPATRTIKIFLASSEELLSDRDAFELHFRRENDRYRVTGYYLEIVRWENFLDSVSNTRKQDDYNKAIRECDIFVSLFATKAGQFTAEEFDTAYAQFKTDGVPSIFTFFKDSQISTGNVQREDMQSLWDMKDKLAMLGHFYTSYKSDADLLLSFSQQLQKMTDQGKLN